MVVDAAEVDQFWSTSTLPQRFRMSTLDEISKEKQQILHNQAGAGAPRPPNRPAATAARQASAIRSLPWQWARRGRKSLPRARGFGRTTSASRLHGISVLAESRSATGSSTRRTRQKPSSTP